MKPSRTQVQRAVLLLGVVLVAFPIGSTAQSCSGQPTSCTVRSVNGQPLTWGSVFLVECATQFGALNGLSMNLTTANGDPSFPCTFPTRVNSGTLNCTAVLMTDAMFGVPLSLVMSTSTCAAHVLATGINFTAPVATGPDYEMRPYDIDEGAVVSLRLPRRPLSSVDWIEAGLTPPADADVLQMFLGDQELVVPPQDNIIEVIIPPGDGRNLRLTVEIAGLFNVTSDGLNPDDPIPANANSSYYISYRPPEITKIVPPVIQWPDLWSGAVGRGMHALRSLQIWGVDMSVNDATRFAAVHIGGSPCTIVHVNTSFAWCNNWNATEAAIRMSATALDAVDLPVKFLWYDVWTNYTGMVVAWPRPQAILVAPERVQEGAAFLVYGRFFAKDDSCTSCEGAGMAINFGSMTKSTPCEAVQLLSDTAMTCTVPIVDGATPGYPRVTVFVRNSVGAVSEIIPANHTVSFPENIGVQRAPTSPTQLDCLPSGTADGQIFAFSPSLQIEVFGNGTATCWVDVQSSFRYSDVQIPGVGLGTSDAAPTVVGNVTTSLILRPPVGNNTDDSTPSARWTFDPVGLKGSSNALVNLIFRCQDVRGEISISEITPVTVAAMAASWNTSTISFLGAPVAPLTLPTIQAFYFWQNVSAATTAAATTYPDCQAIIIPALANGEIPPVTRPLADYERLSISAASTTVIPRNTSKAELNVNFRELSLGLAELGGQFQLLAECQWLATAERVRLPVQSIQIANLSVEWYLDGSPVYNGRTFSQLPLTPVETHFVVSSNALSAVASVVVCRLNSVSSSTLRLSQAAGGEAYGIDAFGMSTEPVLLEVEGATGTTVSIAVECTAWGRTVRSPALSVTAAGLSLQVQGSLPSWFLPSDGSLQYPLRPAFNVSILDPDGRTVPSITCSISSASRGVTVRLNRDSTTLTSGAAGVIAISEANVQTTFAGDKTPTLALTCRREQRDGPSPLSFTVRMVEMATVMCVSPVSVMQSQTSMPAWSVGVSINGSDPCNGVTADISSLVNSFPPIVCSIESNATTNGNATLFTENGVATLDAARQTAEFGRFRVTGEQGKTYGFTVECTMGSIPVPNVLAFEVQILGCPAGSQASGVFCVTCPERTYSLGGVGATCVGCPPEGVVCTSGILSLLPNYYRSPVDNNGPIGPSTQLFPCFNSEACIVNATDMTYTCMEGYTGALCGVCEPGFGKFEGKCRECWEPGSTNSLVAFLIIGFIGLLAFLALRKPSGKTAPAIILLRIILGFLQALSALQVFKEGGTRAFREIMGWTSFVSESPLSAGALTCGFQWSFVGQYILVIILPWAVVGGVIGMYAAISAGQLLIKRSQSLLTDWKQSLRDYWAQGRPASTLMMTLFVGYMPIVSASLRVLDCYERAVGDRYWLRSNLEIECGVGEHAATRVLAIFMLISYGIGFPFVIFFFLRRANRAKLEDQRFKSAYGFVYDGYRIGKAIDNMGTRSCKHMIGGGHLVWWESIILIRKFAIVFLAVLVADPFYQVVGATLILSAFFMLQQRFQPYEGKLFNIIESLVLGDLFVTVSVSLLLLQSLVDKTTTENTRATVSDILVTVFLVLINMGLLGILLVVWFRAGCQQVLRHRFCKAACNRVLPVCPCLRLCQAEEPKPDVTEVATPLEDAASSVLKPAVPPGSQTAPLSLSTAGGLPTTLVNPMGAAKQASHFPPVHVGTASIVNPMQATNNRNDDEDSERPSIEGSDALPGSMVSSSDSSDGSARMSIASNDPPAPLHVAYAPAATLGMEVTTGVPKTGVSEPSALVLPATIENPLAASSTPTASPAFSLGSPLIQTTLVNPMTANQQLNMSPTSEAATMLSEQQSDPGVTSPNPLAKATLGGGGGGGGSTQTSNRQLIGTSSIVNPRSARASLQPDVMEPPGTISRRPTPLMTEPTAAAASERSVRASITTQMPPGAATINPMARNTMVLPPPGAAPVTNAAVMLPPPPLPSPSSNPNTNTSVSNPMVAVAMLPPPPSLRPAGATPVVVVSNNSMGPPGATRITLPPPPASPSNNNGTTASVAAAGSSTDSPRTVLPPPPFVPGSSLSNVMLPPPPK